MGRYFCLNWFLRVIKSLSVELLFLFEFSNIFKISLCSWLEPNFNKNTLCIFIIYVMTIRKTISCVHPKMTFQEYTWEKFIETFPTILSTYAHSFICVLSLIGQVANSSSTTEGIFNIHIHTYSNKYVRKNDIGWLACWKIYLINSTHFTLWNYNKKYLHILTKLLKVQ